MYSNRKVDDYHLNMYNTILLSQCQRNACIMYSCICYSFNHIIIYADEVAI